MFVFRLGVPTTLGDAATAGVAGLTAAAEGLAALAAGVAVAAALAPAIADALAGAEDAISALAAALGAALAAADAELAGADEGIGVFVAAVAPQAVSSACAERIPATDMSCRLEILTTTSHYLMNTTV